MHPRLPLLIAVILVLASSMPASAAPTPPTPSPSRQGMIQFFNLAWLFFDMGTSLAFIKFLSEIRVHDPARGIKYGQLFVSYAPRMQSH